MPSLPPSIDIAAASGPAPREVKQLRRAAVTLHQLDPLERFECAEKYTGADPGQLAREH